MILICQAALGTALAEPCLAQLLPASINDQETFVIRSSLKFKVAVSAALAVFSFSHKAMATEGGLSVYPNGTENFMAGALPPPGVYGMVFGNHYSSDRVNDNNGNRITPPDFKITANVVAGRIAWVPGVKVLGGDLVAHAIFPLVDLKVRAGGVTNSKSGLADITTGLGVGYHHSPNLHSVVAVDVFVPAGSYDKNAPVNIGKNHWAIEPVYAISYIDPKGFNGDLKFGYILNGRNKDTNYTSGDEFHFDYSAGWGLGNGWTVGVGGYYYQQVTDDKQNGVTVANNKGRAFAIGPNVKYDSGKGWFATLKWETESGVKNRAEGQSLWLKTVFPF